MDFCNESLTFGNFGNMSAEYNQFPVSHCEARVWYSEIIEVTKQSL